MKFLILLFFIVRCSSVTAYWYSEPEDKFIYYNEKRNSVSARAVTEKAVFEVWSASAEYPVMSGPLLLPFFSVEPPVLNSEHLNLNLEFSFVQENIQFDGKILKESLRLKLDSGEEFYPDLVVLYEKNGDGNYEIMKTYSGTPEYIPFTGAAFIEITYFSVVYSQVKKYSFRPVLKLKSSDIECPVLNFVPERKRTYIPYKFPFSLPIK